MRIVLYIYIYTYTFRLHFMYISEASRLGDAYLVAVRFAEDAFSFQNKAGSRWTARHLTGTAGRRALAKDEGKAVESENIEIW